MVLKQKSKLNHWCIDSLQLSQETCFQSRSLPALYHTRWRVEEFYKLLKQTFDGKFYNNKSFKSLKRKIYFQQLALLINQFTINAIEKDRAVSERMKNLNNQPIKKKDKYPISKKQAAKYIDNISYYLLYNPLEYRQRLEFTIYRISNYYHNKVRDSRSFLRQSLGTICSKWNKT